MCLHDEYISALQSVWMTNLVCEDTLEVTDFNDEDSW